ncbi:MAG: AmmeMemoRadiSam system protein B [Candidatus Bathyarchaeia archaeon]|nr:AmmeMemoRadiSam system protein B [Candidatus Bathyarchaeota archaeon]
MKIRKPFQAGAFYAGRKEALIKEIESCFLHKLGPGKIPKVNQSGERVLTALVCPHAGYMYSGPIAAHSYYVMALDGIPDTAIIIGPNHTGLGSGVSMMSDGYWETPLGVLQVDSELAKEIYKFSNLIDLDESAHLYEHSIEVQLPFLQYLYNDKLTIVPICMMMQDLETSIDIGKAVAEASKERNVIIIASSDMTHYETAESAKRKDKFAIDAILSLDESKLESIVYTYNVSMCGYGPVAAALKASKMLNNVKAKLLAYGTSGDITGDYSSVVGYAAIAISKEKK